MGTKDFERNMEALAEQPGELAFRDGLSRLRPEGAEIRASPAREAWAQLDVPADAEILFLGSCGIGLLQPHLDRIEGRLMLVEPDSARLSLVLSREDLAAPIRDRRLLVYPQSTPDAIVRDWVLPKGGSALSRLILVDGAGREPKRSKFFSRVREGVAARERDAALDVGAEVSLGSLVVENALKNLALLSEATLLEPLWTGLEGSPGIVVAAGPSLDGKADLLKKARSGAVILAVDTAVKALACSGVRPHLVLGVDPRERNVQNLTDADLSESFLLAEVSSHPDLVRMPAAGRALFVADNPVGKALRELDLRPTELPIFGSVTTAAFEVACRMGLNPIIFVGQDLAFTDDKQYCHDTDPASSPPAPDSEMRSEDDIHGNMVRTTLRLQSFRDWLEARIQERPRVNFINATGAGILKRGVTQMSLEEVLDRYSKPSVSVKKHLRQIPREVSGVEAAAALNKLGAQTKRALRVLKKNSRRDPKAALESYSQNQAVVTLIEVLQAGELLRLKKRWNTSSLPARENQLFQILIGGLKELAALVAAASA